MTTQLKFGTSSMQELLRELFGKVGSFIQHARTSA